MTCCVKSVYDDLEQGCVNGRADDAHSLMIFVLRLALFCNSILFHFFTWINSAFGKRILHEPNVIIYISLFRSPICALCSSDVLSGVRSGANFGTMRKVCNRTGPERLANLRKSDC